MSPESIRICAICGKREEEEEEFGRCLCQRIVCSECWDFDAGKCKVCTEEEKKGFEKPDVDLGESTLILKRGTKKKSQPEDLFGAKKKKKVEEEEKEVVHEEPHVEQKDIKTQIEEQKEEAKPKVEEKPVVAEVKKEVVPEVKLEVKPEINTDAIVEIVLAQVLSNIPKTEAVDLSPVKGKIETLDKRIEDLECAKSNSNYENDLAGLKGDLDKIKSDIKALADKAKVQDAKEVSEETKSEIKKIARQYIEEKMQQEIPERLEVITYKSKEDIIEQVNAKIAATPAQINVDDIKSLIGAARKEIETEMNSRLAPLVDLIQFKNNLNIGAEIDKLRQEYKKELEARLDEVVKQIKAPQVLEELVPLVDSAELIKKRSSEGWSVISSTVIGDNLSLTFKRSAKDNILSTAKRIL